MNRKSALVATLVMALFLANCAAPSELLRGTPYQLIRLLQPRPLCLPPRLCLPPLPGMGRPSL